MKTVEYLDAVKAKLELTSDYQLAKVLELRPSAISAYRNNGGTFGKATAIKVAKILGVHQLTVRADAQVERAKTPEDRALLRELASKIVGVLVAAGAGALLMLAGPAEARFNISKSTAPSLAQERAAICIAGRFRRWLRSLFCSTWRDELAGARP